MSHTFIHIDMDNTPTISVDSCGCCCSTKWLEDPYPEYGADLITLDFVEEIRADLLEQLKNLDAIEQTIRNRKMQKSPE